MNLHLKDGVAVDASLTSASREFLKKIASEIPYDRRISNATSPQEPDTSASSPTSEPDRQLGEDLQTENPDKSQDDATDPSEDVYETIEVPLVFDAEFFDMLQTDVNSLDTLQSQEEKRMTEEIVALGKEVAQVAKPTRFSKSDLARWRHIFELYLDAEIFFATHEQDHGARSSQVALKQLQWFQNQVEKQQLIKGFKLAESKVAFARFLSLNADLLKNLQFQELNKTAITKILKSKWF